MIQQKYLWSFLAMMMAAAMGVGLISCGEEDDDDELSKESEIFLGLWRGNYDPDVILFQTKGKAISYKSDNPKPIFSWKYDKSSQILSTTIPYYTGELSRWEITSLTDENWNGVALFEPYNEHAPKNYHYERCTNDNIYGLRGLIYAIFASRKWVSKSGEEMVFTKKGKDEYCFRSDLTGDIYPEAVKIDSNSIYVKDYNPYYSFKYSYMTFIIHNPSDYDNIYITVNIKSNLFDDFTDDYYPSDN